MFATYITRRWWIGSRPIRSLLCQSLHTVLPSQLVQQRASPWRWKPRHWPHPSQLLFLPLLCQSVDSEPPPVQNWSHCQNLLYYSMLFLTEFWCGPFCNQTSFLLEDCYLVKSNRDSGSRRRTTNSLCFLLKLLQVRLISSIKLDQCCYAAPHGESISFSFETAFSECFKLSSSCAFKPSLFHAIKLWFQRWLLW